MQLGSLIETSFRVGSGQRRIPIDREEDDGGDRPQTRSQQRRSERAIPASGVCGLLATYTKLEEKLEMIHRSSCGVFKMSLPVQIVDPKGVNESIFLGIPHNGRREREVGMNREGDRVSPQRRSTCGRRCSLLCSLSVRLTVTW